MHGQCAMSKKIELNTKPFSGYFSDWVLLTWQTNERIMPQIENKEVGSTTICLGVLQSDARSRFTEYRPIETTPLTLFDSIKMEITTKNSRYRLMGKGRLQKVSYYRLETQLDKIRREISKIAYGYRNHVTH